MELKTKPPVPAFHQPEDLVLLVTEGAKAGTFQIVPQIPDAPQAPFSFKSPISADDQDLLRWYIEESHVRQAGTDERSARAEQLIKNFGRKYFHQLFSSGAPLYDWWHEASQRKSGRLIIVSDSPIVHRVHWEFLRDETEGMPAFDLGIRIVRKLLRTPSDHSDSSLSLPGQESKIRILVVRPRPKTAHLQLPGGSIWDELRQLDTISVEECTPPTLEHLRSTLHAARLAGQPFAIVHFDGHGLYTDGLGALIFEDDSGNPDSADGDRLGTVFRGVPVVVLDACRTAATGGPAWEAVAPLLLRLGVRSVIAMPYAAHIDMLRRLFDRFYRELSLGRTIGGAFDEARRSILVNQRRRPQPDSKSPDSATIRDWWVPQLFQSAKDHALLVGEPGEEAPPLAEVGPTAGHRHPRRTRPVLKVILALIAVVMVLFWLKETHRRTLDTSLKERSRVNDDCANGNNPNQCAAALELNNDCCKKHSLDWSQCCYRAGLLHEAEKPPHLAAAAQSYEEACDANPPEPLACLNLGILYQTGAGVLKKDLRKAVNLFTIACYAGITRSCSNVGRTYLILYQQTEKRPDFDAAKQFLERACAQGQGDPGGCTALGKWYDLNQQPDQAFKMYRLACSKKDAIGCARMGDITPDISQQVEHYQHACAMNDEEHGCPGCIQLAQVYASGQFGKMGPRDANALYKDLCERGCGEGKVSVAEACRRLADDFREVTAGRAQDLDLAAEYYQKGCDGSDGVSCGWLGYLRQERAPQEAAHLFSKGCTLGARSSCCMARQLAAAQGNSTLATQFRKLACELDLECCAEFD